MKAEGLDPASDDDAARYNTLKWQRFMAECNAIIQAKWPQATIFYNGGASQYHPAWHGGNTHFELNGVMDMPTYENIGHAYAYVEQIEEYGLDGAPCANLGVFLSGSEPDDQGVANMLMENQIDFEVVAPGAELNRFAALVLPGAAFLDETTAARHSARWSAQRRPTGSAR
ncbi:MAG: hypothetical protein ACUVRU_13300 [Anaerolineae bacterium]